MGYLVLVREAGAAVVRIAVPAAEAQRRPLKVSPEAHVERHLGSIVMHVQPAVAARGSPVGHDERVMVVERTHHLLARVRGGAQRRDDAAEEERE